MFSLASNGFETKVQMFVKCCHKIFSVTDSLSFSLSLSLSLSLYLFITLSLTLSHYISVSVNVSLSIYLSLSLSKSIHIIYISLSKCELFSMCLSLSIFLYSLPSCRTDPLDVGKFVPCHWQTMRWDAILIFGKSVWKWD